MMVLLPSGLLGSLLGSHKVQGLGTMIMKVAFLLGTVFSPAILSLFCEVGGRPDLLRHTFIVE